MSISYIYISFIKIKTCDKYDASSSVNEQIKTYILTTGGGGGGGGGKKIQKLLIFTTILGRENTKTLFSRSFFSWGGGEKKRRNKVGTYNIYPPYNTILIFPWRYDILMIFSTILPDSQRLNFVEFGTVSFRNFANK